MLRGEVLAANWGATGASPSPAVRTRAQTSRYHRRRPGVGVVVSAKDLSSTEDLQDLLAGLDLRTASRISAAGVQRSSARRGSRSRPDRPVEIAMPAAEVVARRLLRVGQLGLAFCVPERMVPSSPCRRRRDPARACAISFRTRSRSRSKARGFRNEIDLTSTREFRRRVGIKTALDSGTFDERASILAASVIFDGRFGPVRPERRPWLSNVRIVVRHERHAKTSGVLGNRWTSM